MDAVTSTRSVMIDDFEHTMAYEGCGIFSISRNARRVGWLVNLESELTPFFDGYMLAVSDVTNYAEVWRGDEFDEAATQLVRMS